LERILKSPTIFPSTLQGFASFGRWSVEIGVRPEGQGERVALGPEAHRAGLDHLLRAGLELCLYRRGKVDLFTPGLRGRFEREVRENGL
jgi:hypothetical protein